MLQPNLQVLNKYKVIRKLGKGGFSEVYLAQVGMQQVALKVTPFDKIDEKLQREAIILFNVQHPNITKVYDQISFSNFNVVYYALVMEVLQPLQDWREANITNCMICLKYFEQQKIVHRDLKLDNVMLRVNPANSNEYIIRITDFNLAKILEPGTLKQSLNVGNWAHRAPETFIEEHPDYSATDIWAIGIMVRILVEGSMSATFPYTNAWNNHFSAVNIIQRITLGQYDPIADTLPLFFKSFVNMTLEKSVEKRKLFVDKFLKDPELQELIAGRKELATQAWCK